MKRKMAFVIASLFAFVALGGATAASAGAAVHSSAATGVASAPAPGWPIYDGTPTPGIFKV